MKLQHKLTDPVSGKEHNVLIECWGNSIWLTSNAPDNRFIVGLDWHDSHMQVVVSDEETTKQTDDPQQVIPLFTDR